MSARSWGHAAGLLPEAERTFTTGEPWPYSGPKCKELVTHWTSYRYVTGRAGRVSTARKRVCAEHAQRFAEKHGVEITELPPPIIASQAAVGEFLTGGAR